MKNNIHVGVTGLQSMDNPDPGLAVARSLKHDTQNIKVIGLSYGLHCTANFFPYFDQIFLIPFPWDSPELWLDRIQSIHHSTRLDVIVPNLDSEIVLFSQLSDPLAKSGIHTLLPSELSVKTRLKNFLPEWCQKYEIETPKTAILLTAADTEKLAGQLGYPCFIKGAVAGAYLARNQAEAVMYFKAVQYYWGLPVIAQESVRGEDFDVAALADKDSCLIASIAMKKMAVTSLGKGSIGSIVDNPEIITLTEKIIQLLKWVGPLEVELVYNSFRRKFYLIEINARFPAWIYLSAASNYNLPLMLVKMAMGEKMVPMSPCPSGTTFYRNKKEIFFDGSSYGELAATGELKTGDVVPKEVK